LSQSFIGHQWLGGLAAILRPILLESTSLIADGKQLRNALHGFPLESFAPAVLSMPATGFSGNMQTSGAKGGNSMAFAPLSRERLSRNEELDL
jgi:hypothetical protein